MRILGFTKKWDKLQHPEFTTFRFRRKDADWWVGEVVQLVFHPYHKDHELLGLGKIISIDSRSIPHHKVQPKPGFVQPISDEEAIADGFSSFEEMRSWIQKTYGRHYRLIIHKLTIRRTDLG